MITYFQVKDYWATKVDTVLVPEHIVKLIIAGTVDGRDCVKLHLIGGGCYTVWCTLETFIDSNRVEL